MTHRDKSAVRGLIEEILGTDLVQADHGDAMRRLLAAALQDLIDAEATARIGAGRYERSPERTTHRNGNRSRQLATPAGQVALAIPKLREGAFFPSLLEPRRRIDQALWAVIAQAWIQGVSTRRVDALVKALGNEAGISKSQVSRICAEIDEYVHLFLDRRLDEGGGWYPYLWLDATYLDVRIGKRVVSQAVVVAPACSAQGHREILGMAVGDTETTDFWTSFLRGLRDRGLKAADPSHGDPTWVALVISDAHSGLKAAVKAILPGASWQRCRVHFARNITQHLGSARSKPVNALIGTIFAQPTAETVTACYRQVTDSLTAGLLGDRFGAAVVSREDCFMPQRYPEQVKDRAIKMVLSHLDENPSPYAAARALAPRLGVGAETLRRWVVVASATPDEAADAAQAKAESKRVRDLERKVRDLEEANEILKAASIFFAGELDPRRR